MLTKQIIKKEFEKDPEKYWEVELFKEKGFVRKQCEKCGKFFWTLQQDRKVCPDQPCSNYEFIGKPVTKVKWDYIDAWKEFEKFFVKNGHTSIKRYPVVSRWHPKLFFTIASIQDFQRIEPIGVVFEYPENPLIVPQISLRFNDIPNVGVTGKHMTCFQMNGQHAFNDETGKGYWKDRCIELNFNFLTKIMGIPEQEVIYVGNVWAMPDFSAFGPCVESFSKGLEIANNVFMQFKATNSSFTELQIKTIDVGWGHERLSWFTQGTATVYEVAFGPVMEKLMKATDIEYDKEFFVKYSRLAGSLDIDEVSDVKLARIDMAKQLKTSVDELERKIAPLEAMFAIADHTKALVFAIADGGIPSNVGGGYNLRVILRRALSFIDKLKLQLKLTDVAFWHIDYLKKMFPELVEHKEEIATILEVEEKRYRQAKERTKKIVDGLIKTGKSLTEEDLIKYYDSDGITPEQLVEAGLKIEIPPRFYAKVTEKHMGEKPEEKKLVFDVTGLPETKILFYEKPDLFEFKAKILKVFENKFIVLDRTAFYPRQGGQECDLGYIDGHRVVNVFKIGDVVIHELESTLESKENVTVSFKKAKT